ncbi:MAG TPA: MFS transporter [Terriglobales bacterium]
MAELPRPEPSRSSRWVALLFLSLAMFGNYYVYDSIAPVADLLAKQLGFSNADIGWLQAIYNFPNIFMVVVGGYVVDRIGVRRALLIFGAICFAGSAITVLSGTLKVMAAGRLVFGLGAESLIVAVTTAIAKWFRGKDLSFAFGVQLMLARFGTWLAQNSPTWARGVYESWRGPLLISVVFGGICFLGAVLYWWMEAHTERKFALGQQGSTDKLVFQDIFDFGLSYWYIVALCVVFYAAIFPFETFAIKFFIEAHGTSRELGGFLVSILTAFTMFGTPAFGLLADRIGRRALLMMFGSTLLIPVYLMMAYTHISLYVPMAMMGIAFSLIPAVMWPSVAYLVDQSKLGTAYGLMTMLQNIGFGGLNLVIGWANDHSQASAAHPEGYRLGMWIFSVLGFLGVFFAFLLRQRETGPHGHGLETITAKAG